MSKSNLLNPHEISDLYTECRRNAMTIANLGQILKAELVKMNSKEFRSAVPPSKLDDMDKLVSKLLKHTGEIDKIVDISSKLEMHMSESYYSTVRYTRARVTDESLTLGR